MKSAGRCSTSDDAIGASSGPRPPICAASPTRCARQQETHLPHVRANGLDIHYTVEGAGPPVIMLHGATSAADEDWAAQRPLFRKAFRIYLVDARGHGGTKWDA